MPTLFFEVRTAIADPLDNTTRGTMNGKGGAPARPSVTRGSPTEGTLSREPGTSRPNAGPN